MSAQTWFLPPLSTGLKITTFILKSHLWPFRKRKLNSLLKLGRWIWRKTIIMKVVIFKPVLRGGQGRRLGALFRAPRELQPNF